MNHQHIAVDNPTLQCSIPVGNLNNPMPQMDWSETSLSSMEVDLDKELEGKLGDLQSTSTASWSDEQISKYMPVSLDPSRTNSLVTVAWPSPTDAPHRPSREMNPGFLEARLQVFSANIRYLTGANLRLRAFNGTRTGES